jgi:hypothetical protein
MRTAFVAVIFLLFVSVYLGLPVNDDVSAAGDVQVVTGIGEKKCTDGDVVSKQNLPNGGHCYFNSFKGIDEGLEDPQLAQQKKKKKTYKQVRKTLQKQKYCMEERWTVAEQLKYPGKRYCVPDQGDPTCSSSSIPDSDCRKTSDRSDAGCVIISGCLDPAVELPPVGVGDWILNGAWLGDPVADRVRFPASTELGLGVFPPPDGSDLYWSRTGAYIPEERFSFVDGTFRSGANSGESRKGVPRDDVLRLHPSCAGNTVDGKNEIRYREGDTGFTASTIQCLANDYIDDVDDFCSSFGGDLSVKDSNKKIPMYTKNVWNWDGGCWRADQQPRVFQERLDNAQERWMPLAREVELAGTMGILPVNTDPYSNRYGDLGEYGYLNYKIARDDVPYDRKNIYNLKEEPTPEQILSLNFMGIKRKKTECVKMYIEEWAHKHDCSSFGPLVDGEAANANLITNCQWVSVYDSSDNMGLLVRANAKNKTPRGMRSEHFDYENFNRAGYIPNLLDRSDICQIPLKMGDGKKFWDVNGLDFSKRGCPTVSGPNLWPGTRLTMKGCDYSMGAPILDTDYWGLYTGPLARSFLLTADIEKQLLSIQLSVVWGLATGGAVGVPIAVLPDVGKIDDWIDYSWTAASCIHTFNSGITLDYWNQTADYNPSAHCVTLGCNVAGFEMEAGRTVYDYTLNASQLGSPAFWCEFELPYYPFESGTDRILKTANPLEIQEPSAGDVVTDFKMVERIRNGCGAFAHRGTWSEDKEVQLTKWITGKLESRCDGWTGMYGRKHSTPKVVSWRLPRFNYEFMKSFIECTGPVTNAKKVCGSVDWVRIAYNCLPKTYGGCGCCWNLDDKTVPDDLAYEYGGLTDGLAGGFGNSILDSERPGFWCRCKSNNLLTTRCDESFCTCNQFEVSDAWLPTFCESYGPFKRWLQCYYQARAKACPVLTREISSGILPGTLLVTADEEAVYNNNVNSSSVQRSGIPPVFVTPDPIIDEPEVDPEDDPLEDPEKSVAELIQTALEQGIDALVSAQSAILDNLSDTVARINIDLAIVQAEKDAFLQEQIDLPADNTQLLSEIATFNAEIVTLNTQLATAQTQLNTAQDSVDDAYDIVASSDILINDANNNIATQDAIISGGPAAIAAQQAIIDAFPAPSGAVIAAANAMMTTISNNVAIASASRSGSESALTLATSSKDAANASIPGLLSARTARQGAVDDLNDQIGIINTNIAIRQNTITLNDARILLIPDLIDNADVELGELNSDLATVNGWISTATSQSVAITTVNDLKTTGANTALTFKGLYDAAGALSLYNHVSEARDISLEDKYDDGVPGGSNDVLGDLEKVEDSIEVIIELETNPGG